MAKVYCLKKKNKTNEFHLFECEKTLTGCNCPPKSICKKMDKSDQIGSNEFTCENENGARMKVAEIGRQVCGDCISHLYETYD